MNPNPQKLPEMTPSQLEKELVVCKLQTASIELSLAATCLQVNANVQMINYFAQAVANLDDARKMLFPTSDKAQVFLPAAEVGRTAESAEPNSKPEQPSE